MTALLRRGSRMGVIAGMLLLAGGCGILGVGATRISGPPDVKARYVPVKEPMLVLAESYGNASDVEGDADHLSLLLVKQMADNKIAPTVDPTPLERLRDKDPEEYKKMTIDALGRAAGARQVLYVNVIRAEIENPAGGGGDQMRGVMSAEVRIVDSNTGETRWPPDVRDGALVTAQTQWEHSDDGNTQAKVRDDMVEKEAEEISKLFHNWKPDNEMQQQINEETAPIQ